jgi:anti-sigma regulatory factor (Ser/Thr protein kinase)
MRLTAAPYLRTGLARPGNRARDWAHKIYGLLGNLTPETFATGLGLIGTLSGGGGVEEAERRFPLDPVSVRQARAFVVDALADIAVDGELVRLLTSELATNAVLHAESDFRVRLRTDLTRVRVEVINTEPELLLAMREPSAQGGRRLQLVKELAADWAPNRSETRRWCGSRCPPLAVRALGTRTSDKS